MNTLARSGIFMRKSHMSQIISKEFKENSAFRHDLDTEMNLVNRIGLAWRMSVRELKSNEIYRSKNNLL